MIKRTDKEYYKLTSLEQRKVLEQDPEWVAMMAEKERKHEEKWAVYYKLEEPIILELKSAGVCVDSIWSIGGKGKSHEKAVPILLKHLFIFYDDWLNSGIARALGRIGATEYWDILVDQFCKIDGALHPQFKDGLACALFDTVTKKTMPEYISLLRDKRHGESRILMVGKLRRLKQPEIIALVDELFEDPDLRTEIGSWKRFKGRK